MNRNAPRQRQALSQAGFTLLEVVVSLVLIGLALFTAAALLVAHPRAVRQVEAERELLAVAEAAIEGVRSGLLPLADADLTEVVPRPTPQVVTGLSVRLTVREAPDRDGLYRVTVVVRGTVLDRDVRRALETMVWRAL